MRLNRPAAAAALLAAAAAAQASITTVTSQSSFLAQTSASVDNLNSLATIYASTNAPLGTASVLRSAGTIGYTASTDSQSQLWVVPIAGNIGLSVDLPVDTLTLASFSQPVYAVGANFFATSFAFGELSSGGISLLATDINGLTQAATLAGNSLSGFMGFVSDVPLQSVSATLNAAASALGDRSVTLDNVAISAVPEPGSWLLMLGGAAAVLRVASRRRA